MDYCKKEINLGSTFAKLNDQDLQELQRDVDKYVEFYEDLLENMDKEFMLSFHGSTQKQLYIMRCAYEKDLSRPLDLTNLTCAFNIPINLMNEKYYNQSQSSRKGNQLHDQGGIEESSNLKDHHESEEYMEEWNQPKEDSDEDLQDANLRIENMHGMSESPIKVCEDEHNEARNFIQEGVLGDMNIVAPCEDDISDFLCISEGKWDVGNHHFSSDPIDHKSST